jgi:hypothetical protein
VHSRVKRRQGDRRRASLPLQRLEHRRALGHRRGGAAGLAQRARHVLTAPGRRMGPWSNYRRACRLLEFSRYGVAALRAIRPLRNSSPTRKGTA